MAHPQLLRAATLARASQVPQAIACLRETVAQNLSDAPLLIEAGRLLLALGARAVALEVTQRLEELSPARADLSDAVGTLYTHCDEPLRALPFFERAVALAPRDARYRYNLAVALRMAGELEAAEHELDQVVALAPDDAFAHYTRSDLRTQSETRHHLDDLRGALGRARRDADRVLLCFALAKELDDLGQYAQAFGFWQQGSTLHRRTYRYAVGDDVAVLTRLLERHDAAMVQARDGLQSTEPLFVFGLPRTGTTLVEQILAAHPGVFGAGELQAFTNAAVTAVQRDAGRPVSKLEFVDRGAALEPRALGEAYLRATRPQTGHTPHFVDKQPNHYLYAGLIHRALPQARLVALMRDPMDACFAMYRTLFVGAFPFSYDLQELAAYYTAWHRLMRHWREVIGAALLLVSYEELVHAPEATTRRMLAHCGLDWDERCLAFDRQRRPVATASAAQVRKPLYATSVGKWRNYAQPLEPLREALAKSEPAGGWGL
jgi:tetratricopeptide (TPR) repeat protein